MADTVIFLATTKELDDAPVGPLPFHLAQCLALLHTSSSPLDDVVDAVRVNVEKDSPWNALHLLHVVVQMQPCVTGDEACDGQTVGGRRASKLRLWAHHY